MRLRQALGLLVFGIATLSSSRAQGFFDWRWSFQQSAFVVGPSDSIPLSATIFVRPEAPAPLTGRLRFSFSGSLFASYTMECAHCGDARLSDVNIAPGDSFSFDIGTLVPRFPLAPGMYRNLPDEPLIDFDAIFTRRIADSPLRIEVVPEPPALGFAFLGLALLLIRFFASHRKTA